jgi:YD repeat-containing protein
VWRDDGWTIVYHLGQLSSIRTDEGHVFNWDYDSGTHMATGISKDGQPLVSVERNEQGFLGAVVINGKRFEMTYAQRPLTQMLLGQPAIKELALALSSFKYPDGKSDTFKFVLSQQLVPSLTFTDLDQKQTAYSWDVSTSHIATEQGPDGSWTYKVGDVAQSFGSPSISRTNLQGQTEGMTVDNQMGTYTQKGLDGVTTVTHVFETPGPLYHKVQKIEKIRDDVVTLNYRASYDEEGRLIRKIDDKGFVTSLEYGPFGKITKENTVLGSDPKLLKTLADEESELLQAVKTSKSSSDRDDALYDLATFYTSKMLDFKKALFLVNQMTNSEEIFNIELFAALGDPNMPEVERNSRITNLENRYPDHKAYMEKLVVK